MKIFVNYLCICIFMFLYGCNDKNIVGYGTPPKFEHGPHVFGKAGGKITIRSENDNNWWFEGISINGIGTYFRFQRDKDGNEIEGTTAYFDRAHHKLVEPKYPVKRYDEIDGRNHSLVGDWFSIEEVDKRHILINMGENKTGEDIHIRVHIFAGNAMEKDIEIEQKAE